MSKKTVRHIPEAPCPQKHQWTTGINSSLFQKNNGATNIKQHGSPLLGCLRDQWFVTGLFNPKNGLWDIIITSSSHHHNFHHHLLTLPKTVAAPLDSRECSKNQSQDWIAPFGRAKKLQKTRQMFNLWGQIGWLTSIPSFFERQHLRREFGCPQPTQNPVWSGIWKTRDKKLENKHGYIPSKLVQKFYSTKKCSLTCSLELPPAPLQCIFCAGRIPRICSRWQWITNPRNT